MKILGTNFILTKTHTNEWYTNIWDNSDPLPQITDPAKIDFLKILYHIGRQRKLPDSVKRSLYTKAFNEIKTILNIDDPVTINSTADTPAVDDAPSVDPSVVEDICQKLLNFFSEFDFKPGIRFVNTLFRNANVSVASGKAYVKNYFALIDSPDSASVKEKIKSAEFCGILQSMHDINTKKKINKRFKLYYGSQGTGKTTQAIKEATGGCMVCHSAMLPSDLMEDFKFDKGKATFIPSALQNAMVNGDVIVLDEINLLPFESLRFLQTILDGKTSFQYKGKTIDINPGFKVIGTMNLQVNGAIYSLPEPLVDRAEELKEYTLTAKNLVGAVV